MYSRTSPRRIVSLLFIVTIFFFGCSDSPNGPEEHGGGEESWSDKSDEERNELILTEARKLVTNPPTEGGQCKTWIQKVVDRASGQTNHLPLNYIKAGDTYSKAKWYSSSKVDSVSGGAYQTPSDSLLSKIKPGNIIQFRLLGNHNNSNETTGLHTALIESVDSLSMTWIDSNWKGDEMVLRHVFYLSDWSKTIEAWTVYQVK